jgi:hypothetical protein
MYGVNGVPTWNFFKAYKSNHIKESSSFALKLVAHRFSDASRYIQNVGLREFATYD